MYDRLQRSEIAIDEHQIARNGLLSERQNHFAASVWLVRTAPEFNMCSLKLLASFVNNLKNVTRVAQTLEGHQTSLLNYRSAALTASEQIDNPHAATTQIGQSNRFRMSQLGCL